MYPKCVGILSNRHPLIHKIDVQPGTKKSKKGSVLILETDVVVVGSGCGGGLVAGELAQQGFNVLVLEKGSFYQPETLVNMDEADISASLFESKGALMAEDLGVTVLAGSTWGGGSTVNWSASLRPPAAVREEWASRFDMPYFLSRDYQHALDVVCEKIGVSTSAIEHNTPNSLLIQGCQKLGYPFADIPQNTANKPHKCGWCHAGCPNQTKQSSTVTWVSFKMSP